MKEGISKLLGKKVSGEAFFYEIEKGHQPGKFTAYIADAVLHFIIGYAWARAIMQPQYTMIFALIAIFLSGAYTRLAIGMGTAEIYFAWAGPLAAFALADRTTFRTIAYSISAFALGVIAFLWLNP